MVGIEEFIEACKYKSAGAVSELLDSRKFFIFNKYFQTKFINTSHDGTTPLICAVLSQERETVQILLEKGAQADLPGGSGTALTYAAFHRKPDITRLLLEHGANPDLALSNGWTALYLATVGGHVDTVRALLEGGATPYVADQPDGSDLSDALAQGNQPVIEAFALIMTAQGEVIQEDVQLEMGDEALAELNTNSTKLSENTLPDICMVGAPFAGNPPDDIADWVTANRDLMIAQILNIDETDAFEQLQARIEERQVSTVLIPDIAENEILGQNLARGSMLDRSLRVMTQKMSLNPDEFEYLISVFGTDALERCSPVSFCFVFRKEVS